MAAVLNSEKVALTLFLNAQDVQDFLSVLRALRFPIDIEPAEFNGKPKVLTAEERLWRERQAEGQALLVEMAKIQSDSIPELSEKEMMNLINSEIKAYRTEKRTELEQMH